MFTLLFQTVVILSLSLLIIATSACTRITGSADIATPVGIPVFGKVTRDNFLSGKAFCEKYNLNEKEYGRRISVPISYAHPEFGSLEIYAYTLTPFDPRLPSYIFTDGGPGQNTHGIPDATFGQFNEIRFDQRGLGCSSPETFDQYRNPLLYSTFNTVNDMEAIRKAYGIDTWSIYGVSYGTVPATQYASRFPRSTTSVVLEGVVGRANLLHRWSYKASKVNSLLNDLTLEDRQALGALFQENSEDSNLVLALLFGNIFYQDAGVRGLKENMYLIVQDGQIQRHILNAIRDQMKESASTQTKSLPQTPGSVDENISNILFCKELEYRKRGFTTLNYSPEQGFFESESDGKTTAQICDSVGVYAEDTYRIEDFPVKKPVYYFQGSHDGATMATGARLHWKIVPQGKSSFLLAQKGGHNPNLTRLYDDRNLLLKRQQLNLFTKALLAAEITGSDIVEANNFAKPEQSWVLWNSPLIPEDEFDKELKGIRRVTSR